MVFDFNGGDDDNVAQVQCTYIEQNISPLLSLRHSLMADRGAFSLLRPLLQRPSILLSYSIPNPKISPSRSHLLYFSSSTIDSVKVIPLNRRSYKFFAALDEGNGYGRTERRKRGRKRRQILEELFEDNVEEDDNNDGGGNLDLWKILEEIVDNVWILKAFKSYGYLLPFILLSLFFSTGPKAFLVSLAVAIGPSLLFFAFQKLIGWDKLRRTSIANQFEIEEEEEDEMERKSRVRYNPSSVSRGSARMASKFGGWDELDRSGAIPERMSNEPKRKPVKKRKRVRREEAAEPLLLRLLVSLFPFFSSFTNMLK